MSNIFLDSVKKDDSLTSLNDSNDLTRMAYQNKSSDIPLRNSSMTDRFESDTFINHKESFESNNTRINDLNEEIRELKSQCRTLYEKDELIGSLKTESEILKRSLEDYEKCKGENSFLRSENKRLKNDLERERSQIIDFKRELSENSTKDNNSDNSKEENRIDDISENITQEKISVDIEKIKRVLRVKLKDTHEKHIDDLINQYNLRDTTEIDKTMMEELLYKAIHL